MAGPWHRLVASIGIGAAITAIVTLAAAEPQYTRDDAKGEQPVITLKNKAIAIEVYIDQSLRRSPALGDNLMAEARTFRNRWAREADEELKDDPEFFKDGRQWNADRIYSERSRIGHYLSIVRSDRTYSGGAHGNLMIDTILWNLQTRRRVSVRPLFAETADNSPTLQTLAQLARLAVAAKKIEGTADDKGKMTPEDYLKTDPSITDGIKPALLGVGAVSLAPSTLAGKSSGLTFHYPPYAVGPYAEGPHTAFVPWQKFEQYLSAQGRALFGGARTKKDKEDN